MKKITKILSLLALAVIITSCKNEKSLQSYLVESQEKKGFMTFDFPSSFLQLKSDDVSDDIKETLQSIKKINIAALPMKGNEAAYEVEKSILKNIFKDNKEYKTLMSMKSKGVNVKLFYKGETASIDEVIVFGYGKDFGVGVARLLGEDMNPSMILKMMENIKIDTDNMDLKQFDGIFKNNTQHKMDSIQ